MNNIIHISDYKKSKQPSIPPPPNTDFLKHKERIKASLDKIDVLMKQLKETSSVYDQSPK